MTRLMTKALPHSAVMIIGIARVTQDVQQGAWGMAGKGRSQLCLHAWQGRVNPEWPSGKVGLTLYDQLAE